MIVKNVLEEPAIVAGGSLSQTVSRLRDYASKLPGREQLVVLKYARALESIPLILAENARMQTLDVGVEVRSKHAQGKTWFGVNARTGKVGDMMDEVMEPLAVKEEIVKAAT
jgi:chaperonin GroEL (HSP60 family)